MDTNNTSVEQIEDGTVDEAAIAVAVAESTSHDEELAYKLQQEEMVGAHSVPVHAVQAAQAEQWGDGLMVYGTAPLLGHPVVLGAQEQRILETFSLGRGIRCIALLDSVILLFDCLLFPIFFVFVWGPICGYFAGQDFRAFYSYLYLLYYAVKITADIAFILFGAWWFFLVLLIDLWIARFVYAFAVMLGQCSDAELEQMREPSPVWNRARPYFIIF
uniref:Uncharacterized protein n=1 Tax=Fibrocapsa japonica TaxID=94617 RepID=A0A7S2Y004_9STRA